jgi:opacity protein-like surface antigen
MTALRLSLAVALAAIFAAFAFAAVTPDQAQAHRSRCHQAHTCPSDHATYRWRGRVGGITARWLCVHRTSDERNSTFRRRVVYGGRVYFCKR